MLPASAPTRCEPGSEDKVRVMAERLARGEHLHHPGDARIEFPPADGRKGYCRVVARFAFLYSDDAEEQT